MPSGTKYTPAPHETVVTVLCDENYSLRSGDKTRTCQADGRWSGVAPICQRDMTCPRPATPTHGRVVYTPGSTSALYQCDPTYVLHPPTTTRRCNRGQVSAAPTMYADPLALNDLRRVRAVDRPGPHVRCGGQRGVDDMRAAARDPARDCLEQQPPRHGRLQERSFLPGHDGHPHGPELCQRRLDATRAR